MSQEEANKLKRMYLLQEEKIDLLEQIVKEQGITITNLKKKLNIHSSTTQKNVESIKVFKNLISES